MEGVEINAMLADLLIKNLPPHVFKQHLTDMGLMDSF